MRAKVFQQGDVILEKVKGITRDANAKPLRPTARGFVLAEGEATGHAHVLTAEPEACEAFVSAGITYVTVKEATPLVHEEHKTLTITPGTYKIGHVVEVDPFEQEVRRVLD